MSKASAEISAAIIKKEYPEEWRRLQARIKEKSRPELPKKIRGELEKEAKQLLRERYVDFGPTDKYPFVVSCLLGWEEDTCCSMLNINKISPRKGAGKSERRVVKLFAEFHEYLADAQLIDDVYDLVLRSRAAKEYSRAIAAFCKKGNTLEETYDFDFDDLIQSITTY